MEETEERISGLLEKHNIKIVESRFSDRKCSFRLRDGNEKRIDMECRKYPFFPAIYILFATNSIKTKEELAFIEKIRSLVTSQEKKHYIYV